MAAATSGETGCGEVPASGKRGHLGIPEAVFVEDVDSFMKQPGNETADVVLKKLDEQYQKYKFMELNLAQKKRRLKSQIPEIKQTLDILKHMQKKKESTNPMETRFLLADNLYCKASVPPTDKVCLWLGLLDLSNALGTFMMELGSTSTKHKNRSEAQGSQLVRRRTLLAHETLEEHFEGLCSYLPGGLYAQAGSLMVYLILHIQSNWLVKFANLSTCHMMFC
ncbi:prefoldin subunit 3 isoform X1 [Carettochelys insculpta]|uniref:prefoldin subunit 3 isoform X1 n=1 Tax=Carettochelys insculpta TaxID=44489 RepID=UPI003EBF64AE